jgi:protein phosphatase
MYLPPTMSPVATSTREGILEHPEQAFAAYHADGVAEVLCEEKHMGSRAVLLVCRTPAVPPARFGPGAIWTRTGRPFFPPALSAALAALERARARDLPAEAQPGHTLAVAALLDRTRARLANADAFTAAYLRYCWTTDGLAGVRVAPFQVLATEGTVYHERPHAWHLEVADRLAAADPDLITITRRLAVATGDPASVAEGTRWWEDLTAAGGEGMVVKPAANLTRGPKGLVQPGLKVRGREYLRIIYGPDYTEPAHLDRLRQRALSHKRSLALREYALGLEALDRVARGEPLWRVHECVFAVLALESEPVDPRL